MIDVVHTTYALPSHKGDAMSWARAAGLPAHGAALQAAGSDVYHYVLDESIVGLGEAAISRLIAESGVAPHAIDALCVFHTSPCATLPAPFGVAHNLRDACGLSSAWSFSIGQQQCVSPVHALRVLDALFSRNSDWRYAVLVGMDVIMRESLRAIGISGLHSDAASAMLIGRPGTGSRIAALHTYNDPTATLGISDDGRYEANGNYLWSVVSTARRVLRSGGVTPDAISSVLPHNVNRPAWTEALNTLRIPEARLFASNFARIGHAFGSDAAINIADSRALGRPGHHLVFASGIGGTFGGFLVSTGIS